MMDTDEGSNHSQIRKKMITVTQENMLVMNDVFYRLLIQAYGVTSSRVQVLTVIKAESHYYMLPQKCKIGNKFKRKNNLIKMVACMVLVLTT